MPVLIGEHIGLMRRTADSALVIPLCTQESESIGLDYFFMLATFLRPVVLPNERSDTYLTV